MNVTILNAYGEKIIFVYPGAMNSTKEVILDKNLKALIKVNDMSLHKFSMKTKLNKSTLHNYLNGVLPQGLVALIKIADLFDLSLDELVFGISPENKVIGQKPETVEERYEIVIKKIKSK